MVCAMCIHLAPRCVCVDDDDDYYASEDAPVKKMNRGREVNREGHFRDCSALGFPLAVIYMLSRVLPATNSALIPEERPWRVSISPL